MKRLRPLLFVAAVALLPLTAAPALAFEDGESMRRLHWRCDHGDRDACRLAHLRRECLNGDRRACEVSHLRWECEMGDRHACRRIRADLW